MTLREIYEKTIEVADHGQIACLSAYQNARSIEALRLVDWRSIWMWPSIAAGVVMVLFLVLFRDGSKAREPEAGESQS